jgi:hypothetical protein
MPYTNDQASKVIGNTYDSDKSLGFKADVQHIMEQYALESVNLTNDMGKILSREDTKSDFIDRCLESVNSTEAMHDSAMVSDGFYCNYAERLGQLIKNSCDEIAREAVMTGYSPIVSYAPFFIKKQWVACVWKDALMSEVATSPILNYKFEKRYLKDLDGNRYAIPDVYYDKALMAKLHGEATGANITTANLNGGKGLALATKPREAIASGTNDYTGSISVPIVVLQPEESKTNSLVEDPLINIYNNRIADYLTQDTYISGVSILGPTPVAKDAAVTTRPANTTYEATTNIRIDITTHNFIKGKIEYILKDANGNPYYKGKATITEDGESVEIDIAVVKDDNRNHNDELFIVTDELVGNIDFDTTVVNVFATQGNVQYIKLSGKLANRFNHRSLDVERRVEQLQYVMPESGPRLNSAVTVEEASDAIALGKIDLFADNADMMGDALANLNDYSMRTFVQDSFNAQKNAIGNEHGFAQSVDGFGNLIEEGGFSARPAAGYANNITTWMADAKEYFERFLENLKLKLKSPEVTVVCVCHPTLVRYIRGEVKWIFSDQTDVSGLKIQYNLGITNINGDRVHLISSQYVSPNDGIYTILIPTTTELITFKNVFYSVVVDRGYRNPVESLVPNIMATQRMLTFEVIPVQGRFYIDDRGNKAPKSYYEAPDRIVYNKVVT